MADPPEPPSSKPSHRTRNRVLVVVIVVVAVFVALFTVPITSSFSDQIGPVGGAPAYPGAALDPPVGSHVWGTFSVNGIEAVSFEVWDWDLNVIYLVNATHGSFSFTASDPPYTFWAGMGPSESVSVSGHYASPILFF